MTNRKTARYQCQRIADARELDRGYGTMAMLRDELANAHEKIAELEQAILIHDHDNITTIAALQMRIDELTHDNIALEEQRDEFRGRNNKAMNCVDSQLKVIARHKKFEAEVDKLVSSEMEYYGDASRQFLALRDLKDELVDIKSQHFACDENKSASEDAPM